MTRKRKTHSASSRPRWPWRLCANGRQSTAHKFSVHPSQIHGWKKPERLPEVFRGPGTRRADDEAALVPELYQQIGRLPGVARLSVAERRPSSSRTPAR